MTPIFATLLLAVSPLVASPLVLSRLPSPAEVVLAGASPHQWTRGLLVAATESGEAPQEANPQAEDATRRIEEKALEADMDRAREQLGHDHPVDGDAAAPSVDDPHAGHDHGPGDVDRYDQSRGSIDRYGPGGGDDDPYFGDEDPPRRHRRSRMPPGYEAPLHEGRGKAYYLTWGIVDWALAGGSWAVGLATGLTSIGLRAVAVQDGRLDARQAYPVGYPGDADGTRRVHKRDYRTGAIVTGVVSGVLALAGGFFAWRAVGNIDTFRELKEQQRLELLEWRRQENGR